jgi:hypothetical protein
MPPGRCTDSLSRPRVRENRARLASGRNSFDIFCSAGGGFWPTCMVRPCVARGFRRSVGSSVLHQCIRPLIGACAPGHHGYQRACVLISGQASSGPFGSPVFACAGKTGPPSLLILSQTSAGNGICYFIITCSLSVQFLCSCQEAVPSSRPAANLRRRAQGPSRLAVALGSPLARRLQATP